MILPYASGKIGGQIWGQVSSIRANYLLQESAHAHSEDNYYEYSNKMAGYDLLVIDDFGLMDLNLDKE